jgi:hypothetical protein
MVTFAPRRSSRTGPSDFERLAERVRALEAAPDCPFAGEALSAEVREIGRKLDAIQRHNAKAAAKVAHDQRATLHDVEVKHIRTEARQETLAESLGDRYAEARQQGFDEAYRKYAGASIEDAYQRGWIDAMAKRDKAA